MHHQVLRPHNPPTPSSALTSAATAPAAPRARGAARRRWPSGRRAPSPAGAPQGSTRALLRRSPCTVVVVATRFTAQCVCVTSHTPTAAAAADVNASKSAAARAVAALVDALRFARGAALRTLRRAASWPTRSARTRSTAATRHQRMLPSGPLHGGRAARTAGQEAALPPAWVWSRCCAMGCVISRLLLSINF